jgi:hypothetical protein
LSDSIRPLEPTPPTVWHPAMFALLSLVLLSACAGHSSTLQGDVREARGGPKHTNMNDMYLSLRERALRTNGQTAGGLPSDPAEQPFGLVADMAFPNGNATVIAMISGAASIYLSSGGGYIGGEGHEAIRKAAKHAVETAREAVAYMHPTKEYPLPEAGQVRFYALTRGGVMSGWASEAKLENSRNPFNKLYAAVQGVITQYRLINS